MGAALTHSRYYDVPENSLTLAILLDESAEIHRLAIQLYSMLYTDITTADNEHGIYFLYDLLRMKPFVKSKSLSEIRTDIRAHNRECMRFKAPAPTQGNPLEFYLHDVIKNIFNQIPNKDDAVKLIRYMAELFGALSDDIECKQHVSLKNLFQKRSWIDTEKLRRSMPNGDQRILDELVISQIDQDGNNKHIDVTDIYNWFLLISMYITRHSENPKVAFNKLVESNCFNVVCRIKQIKTCDWQIYSILYHIATNTGENGLEKALWATFNFVRYNIKAGIAYQSEAGFDSIPELVRTRTVYPDQEIVITTSLINGFITNDIDRERYRNLLINNPYANGVIQRLLTIDETDMGSLVPVIREYFEHILGARPIDTIDWSLLDIVVIVNRQTALPKGFRILYESFYRSLHKLMDHTHLYTITVTDSHTIGADLNAMLEWFGTEYLKFVHMMHINADINRLRDEIHYIFYEGPQKRIAQTIRNQNLRVLAQEIVPFCSVLSVGMVGHIDRNNRAIIHELDKYVFRHGIRALSINVPTTITNALTLAITAWLNVLQLSTFTYYIYGTEDFPSYDPGKSFGMVTISWPKDVKSIYKRRADETKPEEYEMIEDHTFQHMMSSIWGVEPNAPGEIAISSELYDKRRMEYMDKIRTTIDAFTTTMPDRVIKGTFLIGELGGGYRVRDIRAFATCRATPQDIMWLKEIFKEHPYTAARPDNMIPRCITINPLSDEGGVNFPLGLTVGATKLSTTAEGFYAIIAEAIAKKIPEDRSLYPFVDIGDLIGKVTFYDPDSDMTKRRSVKPIRTKSSQIPRHDKTDIDMDMLSAEVDTEMEMHVTNQEIDDVTSELHDPFVVVEPRLISSNDFDVEDELQRLMEENSSRESSSTDLLTDIKQAEERAETVKALARSKATMTTLTRTKSMTDIHTPRPDAFPLNNRLVTTIQTITERNGPAWAVFSYDDWNTIILPSTASRDAEKFIEYIRTTPKRTDAHGKIIFPTVGTDDAPNPRFKFFGGKRSVNKTWIWILVIAILAVIIVLIVCKVVTRESSMTTSYQNNHQ